MDKGVWQATVCGVTKSQTQLSNCHFTFNKLIGYSELTISGFPGGSVVKNLPASAGDTGLIPGLGRSPGLEMATRSSILA